MLAHRIAFLHKHIMDVDHYETYHNLSTPLRRKLNYRFSASILVIINLLRLMISGKISPDFAVMLPRLVIPLASSVVRDCVGSTTLARSQVSHPIWVYEAAHWLVMVMQTERRKLWTYEATDAIKLSDDVFILWNVISLPTAPSDQVKLHVWTTCLDDYSVFLNPNWGCFIDANDDSTPPENERKWYVHRFRPPSTPTPSLSFTLLLALRDIVQEWDWLRV